MSKAASDRARVLEASGDLMGAATAFIEAGEVESAARVLMVAQRFRDAADLLIRSLPSAGAVESLAGTMRRRALQAALAYSKAGDSSRSAELYRKLGDPVRAREVLGQSSGGPDQPAGRTSLTPGAPDKARLMLEAGDPAGAARAFLNAGMAYEAAECYRQVGDVVQTLDALMRVSRSHPKYRQACVEAIEIAVETDALDFRLDEFLASFLSVPPANAMQAEALYRLSWLYRNNDLPDSASDALQQVARFDPNYRDVARLLEDFNSRGRGSAMAFEKIVREDASFNRDRSPGAANLAGGGARLPNLPPLETAHTLMGAGVSPRVNAGPSAPAPLSQMSTPGATRIEPLSPGPSLVAAPVAGAVAPAAPDTEAPSTLMVGSLPVGTVIDNRYELMREVGRGGMAAVYEAQDRELDERVAMKFFFGGDDAELLARFKQELSLSRKLAHPNIIKVFDIGTFRGCKFISMELLTGNGLSFHIHRSHKWDVLINLLVQTCAGLHAAHEAGVVHRDVKPDNLFVTDKGVVKVMDFGIAKQQAKPGLTRAGYMAGTPHYMAPEQIFSFGSVDRRADIYSLGVLAYEMFCGRLPFQGDDMMQLLQMHVKETPPRPRELVPDLPEGLDALIMKCLEKKAEDRFDSCRSLAMALQAVRAALKP